MLSDRVAPACALVCALLIGACSSTDGPSVATLGGTTMVSGDQQVGQINTALAPLTIRVLDQLGHPFPKAAVTWATNSGSVSPSSTTTDSAGYATATWTLGSIVGPVTATAWRPDRNEQVTFTATAQVNASGAYVFRYVDVGSYHACGILTTEQMVCWGYNGDGQIASSAAAADLLSPQPAANGLTLRTVGGGRYHTCAVTLSGGANCWGQNRDARLAGGTPVNSIVTFRSAQAGTVHSCGLSLAQQVWCWGYNGDGAVGVGPAVPTHLPNDTINPPLFVVGNARAVAVGGLHACALLSDGTARCWGFNGSGQLGVGDSTSRGLPVAVTSAPTFQVDPLIAPHAPDPDFYVPAGAYITAGFAHTCAIAVGAAAYCWGENESGQLGTGTTTPSPTPVAVSGGLTFKALSGGYHHTCGLTTLGKLFCWGGNALGQVGDGSTTARLAPVAILPAFDFQSVSAGETSSCAVTTAGVAYCWGDNEYGQLGVGSHTGFLAPVKVSYQP